MAVNLDAMIINEKGKYVSEPFRSSFKDFQMES